MTEYCFCVNHYFNVIGHISHLKQIFQVAVCAGSVREKLNIKKYFHHSNLLDMNDWSLWIQTEVSDLIHVCTNSNRKKEEEKEWNFSDISRTSSHLLESPCCSVYVWLCSWVYLHICFYQKYVGVNACKNFNSYSL